MWRMFSSSSTTKIFFNFIRPSMFETRAPLDLEAAAAAHERPIAAESRAP
jgi:hypothetical protein